MHAGEAAVAGYLARARLGLSARTTALWVAAAFAFGVPVLRRLRALAACLVPPPKGSKDKDHAH